MQPDRLEPVAPFLRWAGSKRKLIPRIRNLIPTDCSRYVEPFAGSACIFFHAIRGEAVLTDFNPELINAFAMVKQHPRILARRLAAIPDSEAAYYRIRAEWSSKGPELDRAIRFVYLNAHCFNGVYRTNRKGEFNVPRGTRTRGVPSESDLVRCSIALRHASVKCQDYLITLRDCKPDDFVYLDPPYPKPGSRDRGEYGIGAFTPSDEKTLVESLIDLDQNGTKFLLSYKARATFLDKLPKVFSVTKVYVPRSVSGFASGRRRVAEVFIQNYRVAEEPTIQK